ncbi:hypothetical protein CDV55_104528 [Aspergillus turcosus]|nr:hypothetical protein CDV55_104528 [Aspergillus turcosus]
MRRSLPFHPLVLLNIALGAAAWQQHANGDVWEPPYPARCQPDPCANITFTNATYVCGDERLGPVKLPRNFPLSTELATYSRFGDLCPYEFLEKWTYPENGSYHYPPKMGYVLDVNGAIIIGNATLEVGRKVDRFGGEGGNFLAPLGAPYIERSLPPSNLKTFDQKYPYNYHVYEVTDKFIVGLGPVAPWFEQPGMGTQFMTYNNISYLADHGYLRRLSLEEYDEPEEFADNYTPGPNSPTA